MKNRMALFTCFVLAAACLHAAEKHPAKAAQGDPGYTFKIRVKNIDFNWRVAAGKINIKLLAPADGWVGVGFNATKIMKEGRFYLGYVENGKVTISEEYGTGISQHTNITSLGGARTVSSPEGGITNKKAEITFAIPLNAKDRFGTPIEPDGETVLMLAYGLTRKLSQQHAFFTKLKVNLATGAYTKIR